MAKVSILSTAMKPKIKSLLYISKARGKYILKNTIIRNTGRVSRGEIYSLRASFLTEPGG